MSRSENMILYTESLKQNTIQKVQNAIDIIKSVGNKVTRKELLQLSGVSNSVLSKLYIKDLLKMNQVLMYEPKIKLTPTKYDHINVLQKQLNNALRNNEILEHKSSDANCKIEAIENKYKEISRDNEILRGKVQLLLEFIQRNIDDLENSSISDMFNY